MDTKNEDLPRIGNNEEKKWGEANTCARLQKLHDFKKIYLGFSGGADSTALAHILKKNEVLFEAIHFHHHLREESADKDADFCKKFCSQKGIPFRKIDLDVSSDKKMANLSRLPQEDCAKLGGKKIPTLVQSSY